MFDESYDYQSEAMRFAALAGLYDGRKSEWESRLAETQRQEYCRGGLTVIRGYYSPSPLGDVVVGNCSRGTLTKKYSPKTTNYIYSFNEDGQIIKIESVDQDHICATEYILNNEQTSTGILYDARGNVTRIVEERYDAGRLTCLSVYTPVSDGWLLDYEHYQYLNGKLIRLTQHNCQKSLLKDAGFPAAFSGNSLLTQLLRIPADGVIHRVFEYEDFQIEGSCISGFSVASLGKNGPRPKQAVSLPKPKEFSFAPARRYWK